VSVEHSLSIQTLTVRSFRNLSRVDLEPCPGFNVISGDNGQGKTSLLEAVYVLATSKSFRTAKPIDVVEFGAETATVRATILEGGLPREQSVGMGKGQRSVRVDRKRPLTLASYATRTPAVVFHPGALTLSMGGGSERRKLLDRVALYADASPGAAAAYAQAQRSRQRVLETRGETSPELDGWEELMVQHGQALSSARDVAVRVIAPEAEAAFQRIGAPGGDLRVSYVQSAPADPAAFREELARNRARDRARRSPSVGPHRDDLLLELGGHGARASASQGQHRAIVLALHLAEIEVVSRLRGSRPILLLDDVSSELDRHRTSALFASLRAQRGQVLLTTTRPDLLESGVLTPSAERRDYVVSGGKISLAT
jgi:DNA replication and repair protein RecF